MHVSDVFCKYNMRSNILPVAKQYRQALENVRKITQMGIDMKHTACLVHEFRKDKPGTVNISLK